VPELDEVGDREVHGLDVVVGGERCLDAHRVAVHEDDGEPALQQVAVALVVGAGVGVEAGHER